MPVARFEMPDGRIARFEVPEGTTPEQAQELIAQSVSQVPAAVEAGKEINSIPRQLGLTARYGIEGLANAAQLVTEPLRYLTDKLVPNRAPTMSQLVTGERTPKSVPLGVLASQLGDWMGLPSPQGANERVIGDATRLMAGAGGFGGAARAAQALPGAAGQAGAFLSANMPQQLASAAGAGLAGGASREGGGGPVAQGLSALAGGVLGGLAPGAIGSVTNNVRNAVNAFRPGQQQAVQQRVDQTINITLQESGIDPATINPAMRAALREQVGKAMNIGGGSGAPLNPEAVARLADYTRLGLTPTRARLTLDPFDVTQEMNASKLAAATGARDGRLPQIAQANNQRLISTIDDMGGARPVDTYGQGSAVTGAIQAQDEALNAGVGALYQRARGTDGRSLPLDGAAFTTRANQALDEAMVGGALPQDVAGHLNRIARGEVPFTVDYAEQLKTRIAALQRATNDGSVRMALGTVRRALDDTPLMPAPQVNPGNLPAVPGTVPPSPLTAGRESIDAFNQARQAARQRFQWQESSPAITRALEGANADTFIQQNILSKAAGFDQVANTAQVVNANPAAREAVRTSIVQHLKDAAIGKGGTSQTGNFSGRGVEAAIKDIGDRKLGLFFAPEEVETLKAMARTGSFEVFQPRGSAVNNSNTAAGVGGLLQAVSKYVKPIANKVPLGAQLVGDPLDNLTLWTMQRPATNIPQSLLLQQPRPPLGSGLLLPGMAAGGTAAGLLATP